MWKVEVVSPFAKVRTPRHVALLAGGNSPAVALPVRPLSHSIPWRCFHLLATRLVSPTFHRLDHLVGWTTQIDQMSQPYPEYSRLQLIWPKIVPCSSLFTRKTRQDVESFTILRLRCNEIYIQTWYLSIFLHRRIFSQQFYAVKVCNLRHCSLTT